MEFLEIFGIEPRNPVEVNSYGNSKGIIDYELVYVVCGEIISHPSYEISVGKSNIAYYTSANAIEFTNKTLYKELVDPIILFDVFEVCVPWTMKIDYDIVHPKITKKSFVKRVVEKISKWK